MNELKSFLDRMGGLHDAVVRQLVWTPGGKVLRLEIVDLYSNFDGLPEYPGAVSGAIELQEVEQISFALQTDEQRLTIHDFLVEAEHENVYRAAITFWPSGRLTASFRKYMLPA